MLRLKGEKIKEKIAATGYSVREWGQKNNFSQGTLSNWITGARNIKMATLQRLATALHCEPFDIAEVVFVFDQTQVVQLEQDRDEICGLFARLNDQQRQAIINMAQTIADANMKAEEAEI